MNKVPADIIFYFYSNIVDMITSEKEIILLFGQQPETKNGIPTIRIILDRKFCEEVLKKFVEVLQGKDKKKDNIEVKIDGYG
jgi:hypothetical protein